jgi:hypothetical protein
VRSGRAICGPAQERNARSIHAGSPRDLVAVRVWEGAPDLGVRVSPNLLLRWSIPRAAMFVGSLSPAGRWSGRVGTDPVSGRRHGCMTSGAATGYSVGSGPAHERRPACSCGVCRNLAKSSERTSRNARRHASCRSVRCASLFRYAFLLPGRAKCHTSIRGGLAKALVAVHDKRDRRRGAHGGRRVTDPSAIVSRVNTVGDIVAHVTAKCLGGGGIFSVDR